MSRGKYSPNLPHRERNEFIYNADRNIPPEYTPGKDTFNERLHFGDYDVDGFDSYGYSAFDSEGRFVGTGNGIDRDGFTELDYLTMSNDEFMNL